MATKCLEGKWEQHLFALPLHRLSPINMCFLLLWFVFGVCSAAHDTQHTTVCVCVCIYVGGWVSVCCFIIYIHCFICVFYVVSFIFLKINRCCDFDFLEKVKGHDWNDLSEQRKFRCDSQVSCRWVLMWNSCNSLDFSLCVTIIKSLFTAYVKPLMLLTRHHTHTHTHTHTHAHTHTHTHTLTHTHTVLLCEHFVAS